MVSLACNFISPNCAWGSSSCVDAPVADAPPSQDSFAQPRAGHYEADVADEADEGSRPPPVSPHESETISVPRSQPMHGHRSWFRKPPGRRNYDPLTVIPHKLYFACWSWDDKTWELPEDGDGVSYFFPSPAEITYMPFNHDFGPPDLAQISDFCKTLEPLLHRRPRRRVIHVCVQDEVHRTNSIFLLCAAQLILGLAPTAEEAYLPFAFETPPLRYRDASGSQESSFLLSALDALRGLERALDLGWFRLNKFDVHLFRNMAKVENGDMAWLIPGAVLTMAEPSGENAPGRQIMFTQNRPEDLVARFRSCGVKLVVRLSEPSCNSYDPRKFLDHGIEHVDFGYPDGEAPPDGLVEGFLQKMHCTVQQGYAVAVHCKEGRGRSPTLTALYAMRHYGFPAVPFIGWCRLCRPGSILGIQQHFLVDIQMKFLQPRSRAEERWPVEAKNNTTVQPARAG